jgi:hypothetical protein
LGEFKLPQIKIKEQIIKMKIVINVDGWYVKGLGALAKNKIIDLEKIGAESKERILTAYKNKESAFCRVAKEILPVVVEKLDRETIVNQTFDSIKSKVKNLISDKVDADEIDGFLEKINDLKKDVFKTKNEDEEEKEKPENKIKKIKKVKKILVNKDV